MTRESPAGGKSVWYLPDRLGTIRDLVSDAAALVDHIDYTVYGEVESETASLVGDRFKYTGLMFDQEVGLDYDKARWYAASIGRFLSQDPIRIGRGDLIITDM